MSNYYIGNELNIFQNATTWKSYFSKKIIKYIQGDVLEVGAGIGSTTEYLYNEKCKKWTCLEPDASFIQKLHEKVSINKLPKQCQIKKGQIKDLNITDKYNTIIYIDVLEHIRNDNEEILKAEKLLQKNGKIIILSPAYNFLYSKFDKNIGHFRRYNRKMVKNWRLDNLQVERIFYLDTIGILFSFINKVFLKSHSPSELQIFIWDKLFMRITIIIDWIFNYSIGKSIVIILTKR